MEGYALWSHVVELPLDVGSASLARRFVVRHLTDHDLTDLVDDVELVVSELATNAVMHAQTPFTVSLGALDGSVSLMVRDGGVSEPVLPAPPYLGVGGRGLRIVEALCRDWGFSVDAGGGKAVWAVFDAR